MIRKENKSFEDLLLDEEFKDFFVTEENEEKDVKVIPTGSISLDVSLGIGGIPLGRFTEVYGAESSGKTTLAIGICGNALALNHKVLYLDPEIGITTQRIKEIIGEYDPNNFKIMQPDTMEDSLGIAELALKSKEFNLIVLDSIGGLAPTKVKTDKLTDDNVAQLARIMTKFVHRNAYALKYSDTAFLGINQVRDQIGSYMSGYGTPGGHLWKHMLSIRIQLSKGIEIVQDKEKIGIMTKFVVKKNKLAPPFRTYMIPIIFTKGVDTLRDVVEFSTMLGILDKAGPYYKFEGENIGQGLVKTMEFLGNNKDTLDRIKDLCYNVNNLKDITIEESED
jgi:recombination protein RecA